MSTADHIAWTGYVGPDLNVEVDDKGAIQVAVFTRQGANLKLDGYVRSDVSNVDGLSLALNQARLFALAVFPASDHQEFTWQQRRDTYNALMINAKLSIRGDQLAGQVTAFLREYTNAEAIADEGHHDHMTINQYAKDYERWW